MKIIEIEENPFHDLLYKTSGPRGKIRQVNLPFFHAYADKLPEGISSIAVMSDLQGREINTISNRLIGEAVAEELNILQEIDIISKLDIVILAGDLYDYPDCRKLGGTGDVTSVWNSFSNICTYVIGVLGNHDIVYKDNLEENISILDGNTKKIFNINFGGISGIIGKPDRNQRKSIDKFNKLLHKISSSDIIILHQGPDDLVKNQKGEAEIRQFFEKKGKSIIFFGHCHWKHPYIEIGKNQALNVDNRVFIISEKSR